MSETGALAVAAGRAEPPRDCALCPRLRAFILEQRQLYPDWHNAPVPTFTPDDPERVRLLVIGLAPGLRGANRTGRAFTGDWAGDLLYATLLRHGFARGQFEARPDDSLRPVDCAITNAVRCVPPQNKPTGGEVSTCRAFLDATVARFPRLTDLLCLGKISHDSTVRALGARVATHPFRHGGEFTIERLERWGAGGGGLRLHSSYHCSRYNTNTGVLTPDMFDRVVARIRERVGPPPV